jgi:hypothetical protein
MSGLIDTICCSPAKQLDAEDIAEIEAAQEGGVKDEEASVKTEEKSEAEGEEDVEKPAVEDEEKEADSPSDEEAPPPMQTIDTSTKTSQTVTVAPSFTGLHVIIFLVLAAILIICILRFATETI